MKKSNDKIYSPFLATAMFTVMNSMNYIVIFFIIFHYVKSQQTSDSVDDEYNNANEKLSDKASLEDSTDKEKINNRYIESVEKENEVTIIKKNEHNYGAGNPDEYGDHEKFAENMEKAREAGDAADLFGTNQHYNIPVNYQDFGRRFVLTYPYVEKNILNNAAEAKLDNTVKQYLEFKKASSKELTPVKAPPEFVLEIAKQSALLEATKPKNPTNDFIQKDILRTGEYWDDVWKEEVDVKKMLRSNKYLNELESITVEISPGSRLHKLMSMLKERSPRFLYVINQNSERYHVVLFSQIAIILLRNVKHCKRCEIERRIL